MTASARPVQGDLELLPGLQRWAAPTNCNNGLSFDVSSSQCGASFSACFSLDSVDIITPICVTALDACLDNNGQYGVERYRYSAIINLAAWSGCGTDWNIEWELWLPEQRHHLLQNPGSQRLYLNATLDNTLGVCNNSPDFLNDRGVQLRGPVGGLQPRRERRGR